MVHEVQHGGVDPALVHLVTGGDLTPHQARHQTEEHQAWTGECHGLFK